jgi:putative membrane protein
MRSLLRLYLKGLAMGLGDSVPGVSGGTIAVITHIYDRLIYAIKSVDLSACKLLLRGQLPQLWRHIDGTFLLILGLGILSGLLVSANTVLYLLENHYEGLMAFFIGLVLASTWLLKDEFDYLHWQNLLALLLGFLCTWLISGIDPRSVDVTLLYLFFSGMIAICAMILPGLSGAFILLLLGVYQFLLGALISFDLPVIGVFIGGCVIGLLAFSRLLAWLLRDYHQLSYGFITGILLGSLFILWPWKQVLSSFIDSDGVAHPLQTVNVWPLNYTEITGNQPLLLVTLASFAVGVAAVLLLRRIFYARVPNE